MLPCSALLKLAYVIETVEGLPAVTGLGFNERLHIGTGGLLMPILGTIINCALHEAPPMRVVANKFCVVVVVIVCVSSQLPSLPLHPESRIVFPFQLIVIAPFEGGCGSLL